MIIDFTISKADVYGEVAKTTGYTGAKLEHGTEEDYERISTVDEDDEQLERFWQECRSEVGDELRHNLAGESEENETYRLSLSVSESFDRALKPSMDLSLRSYFVLGITARWFVLTNKKEASEYAEQARTKLTDFGRKALYKRRPGIPAYYRRQSN